MIKGEKYLNMEDNVVNLEETRKMLRQTAGGGPGGDNWLSTLDTGTIFLSRDKNPAKANKFCDQLCIIEHKGQATNMIQKLPNGQQMDLWFPTLEFSRNNVYVETTAVVQLTHSAEQLEKDQELPDTEETENGSDTGSV